MNNSDAPKGELEAARNCVRDGRIAVAHKQLTEAKEFLSNAKRLHQAVMDQAAKLPPNYGRTYVLLARYLEEGIDQLAQQILINELHGQ